MQAGRLASDNATLRVRADRTRSSPWPELDEVCEPGWVVSRERVELFAARAGDDAGEAPVGPFRADGPGAAAVATAPGVHPVTACFSGRVSGTRVEAGLGRTAEAVQSRGEGARARAGPRRRATGTPRSGRGCRR